MPFDTPEQLLSPSGAKLALRFQPADIPDQAVGIVQICHGLAEHSARYKQFAQFLSRNGFHVFAHDHRGHGLTTASDAPLGQFGLKTGADMVLQDVRFIENTIKERISGLPLVLFGHSMGGLIVLAALCGKLCKPDAVAICNTNFSNKLTQKLSTFLLKAERMYLGSDVPSSILPKLTFHTWAKQIAGHQTQFDWLSHDATEVALYDNDPLCGFDPTVSMWLDVWRFVQMCNDPAPQNTISHSLPVFLQGGGQDPATDFGKSITTLGSRLAQAGLNNITTQIYPYMRHESLHETDRQRFLQDFTAWALRALTTL